MSGAYTCLQKLLTLSPDMWHDLNMRRFPFTLVFACFVVTAPLLAETLKRVLILDVVNYEKDPNFDYLQASITEALSNKLKEKFVFRGTEREEWQSAARAGDLVFLDESYTRTFAMLLGIKMRQDISIGGGFRKVIHQGKPAIRATLFLLDVRNRQVVATIEKTMPPSGELFSAVDALAEDLAKAAEKVLPGKALVEQNRAAFAAGDRSWTILGRVSPAAILGNARFDETKPLPSPSQLTLSYEAGARYEHQRFWRAMGVWLQGQGFYANTKMQSVQRATAVPVVAYGGSAALGISTAFDLRSRLHFIPRLGAGYMLGLARQDFSSYEKPALDINSNSLSSINSLFYGAIVLAGADLVFDMSSSLFLEMGAMAQFYFNTNGPSGTIGGTIGIGWRY
jgi:hypothetical protein